MHVNVVAKGHIPVDTRAYAEQKLTRLERHANLHDVRLLVHRDTHLVPPASAEIVVHLHHTRLTASCQGASVREAIDGAIEKADEQVRRRQDRVGERKGRLGADALPPRG
jgi:ribosomal subunit interface protein